MKWTRPADAAGPNFRTTARLEGEICLNNADDIAFIARR